MIIMTTDQFITVSLYIFKKKKTNESLADKTYYINVHVQMYIDAYNIILIIYKWKCPKNGSKMSKQSCRGNQ